MLNHAFGGSSIRRLRTCHPDIPFVLHHALQLCPFDFGVAHGGGGRTKEEQFGYFINKASKVNPYLPGAELKGKHIIGGIRELSDAVDIYVYFPGHPKASFHVPSVATVIGSIMAVANYHYYVSGKISAPWKSGSDWDLNAIPNAVEDKRPFNDYCHFERCPELVEATKHLRQIQT